MRSNDLKHPESSRVQFANSLRGMACLMVVVAHYCQLYWVAPETVSLLTGLPPALRTAVIPTFTHWVSWLPWVQWGNLGVALFFLISGFVIPFSLARHSPRQFLISRSLRIVPTYMVGFAFTVAAIAWGCHCFDVPLPFSLSEAVQHSVPGLRDLLKIRPIDGIVWTLEIEIKFYLLCALTARWLRKGSLKILIVPLTLAGVSLVLVSSLSSFGEVSPRLSRWMDLWIHTSQYVIFMYVGVVFHLAYQRTFTRRAAALAAGGLLLLAFVVWSNGPAREITSIPWNYGLAVVLFGLASLNSNYIRGGRLTTFFAEISYPLYVVHGVAGYVVLRVLEQQHWQPLPALCVTFVLAVAVAWLIHLAIEVPTQQLGKTWASRYSARPAAQPRLLESSLS